MSSNSRGFRCTKEFYYEDYYAISHYSTQLQGLIVLNVVMDHFLNLLLNQYIK